MWQRRPRRSTAQRTTFANERGEVASWLIVAAGLAAAAVLGSAAMGRITGTLTDNVAVAAEVGTSHDGSGSDPSGPDSSSTGTTDGTSSTDDPAITTGDGSAAVTRSGADGRLGIVSVDENGNLQLVHVDADGTVVRAQAEVTGDADSGWGLSDWHFESRDANNTDLPANVSDITEGDGWTELTVDQSIFHDDPATPDPERKFIHSDGREAVYNPETGELVTDPRYAGTYNYVNPAPMPDDASDIGGWLSWTFRGIGHGVADVLPYFFGGNVRGPDDAGDFAPEDSTGDNTAPALDPED